MTVTSVFTNNRSQAVRLPISVRFSPTVQQVYVRQIGVDRVISPVGQTWDSFFDDPNLTITEDFERGDQVESIREQF